MYALNRKLKSRKQKFRVCLVRTPIDHVVTKIVEKPQPKRFLYVWGALIRLFLKYSELVTGTGNGEIKKNIGN